MAAPRFDLSFLLNQSAYAFAAQLGQALSDLGLSVREYCVLMKAAEEERTQNVVAELASLDKTTMVTTLDALERAGLAERKVSSSDRRARVVAVTLKGRKLLERAHVVVEAAVADSLSALDPTTRATFVEALTTLTEGPWATPSHTAPQRRRQAPVAVR
jgi:MarR family transcriptional regulator for hemolysin